MKTYNFKVVLAGSGNNADEAWRNAVEAFSLDSGDTPSESETEIVEDEDYDVMHFIKFQ